jgi:CheY-like chemotaxis protein
MLAAVTGRAGEADRRGALAAGCDVHLTKPVDLTALREILSRTAAVQAMRDSSAGG